MKTTIQRQSYSSVLATKLEKRIRDGIYITGKALPSTRELARDFGVSRQVVQDALNNLQQRNLLVSKSRIGVFVNPDILPADMKLIVVLSIKHQGNHLSYPEDNFYLGHPSFYPGVQFIHHRLARVPANDADFWYEIDKISSIHPHCLVVSAPLLSQTIVRRLVKLPFAVIFAGEFNDETVNNIPCNMICESTVERGRLFVDAARQIGAKNVVLIGGSLNAWYCRELRDSALEKAGQLNINLRYDEYADSILPNEIVAAEKRQKVIMAIKNYYPKPDLIILDTIKNGEKFVAELNTQGIIPGQDLQILINYSAVPNTIWLKIDRSHLAQLVAEQIFTIMEQPEQIVGKKVFSNVLSAQLLRIVPL